MERYAAAHPGEKAALYSPLTVVRKQGGKLIAVPYHTAYASLLQARFAGVAARAAALSDDPAFAQFLHLRAARFIE